MSSIQDDKKLGNWIRRWNYISEPNMEHSTHPKVIKTPSVVLLNPKYPQNVASAIRACSCFGVSTLIWTGERVNFSKLDRIPREERMKGYRDVYWEINERPLDLFPGSIPICVEITPNAQNLATFTHPPNVVYIFGPEDGSVNQVYRRLCHSFVFIPAAHCLNLAAALNVVLYDRRIKRQALGLEPTAMKDILKETRGPIDIPGWNGS
jgi:tRNA(Leu) C34 or U34 (ribose-2'-O)-methylase TrmL